MPVIRLITAKHPETLDQIRGIKPKKRLIALMIA
jgi:hypothetical protein